MEESVQKAMNLVSRMIEVNKNHPYPENGIPIERFLDEV